MLGRFPTLLNQILFVMNKHVKVSPIVSEGLVALRSISKKVSYTSLIKKDSLQTLEVLAKAKLAP